MDVHRSSFAIGLIVGAVITGVAVWRMVPTAAAPAPGNDAAAVARMNYWRRVIEYRDDTSMPPAEAMRPGWSPFLPKKGVWIYRCPTDPPMVQIVPCAGRQGANSGREPTSAEVASWNAELPRAEAAIRAEMAREGDLGPISADRTSPGGG